MAENPRSHVNIVNFPSTCLCLTSPLSNFGFVFSGDTVDLRAERKSNVKTSVESRMRSNATGNLKTEGYCCRIDWNTVILACSSVAMQGPASSRETHIVCNMNKQEQLRGEHNIWIHNMISNKQTKHKQIVSLVVLLSVVNPGIQADLNALMCFVETVTVYIHRYRSVIRDQKNRATLLELEVSCKSSMFSNTKLCWSTLASHHTVIWLFLGWLRGKWLPPSFQLLVMF